MSRRRDVLDPADDGGSPESRGTTPSRRVTGAVT
jgi:hypothetical protein